MNNIVGITQKQADAIVELRDNLKYSNKRVIQEVLNKTESVGELISCVFIDKLVDMDFNTLMLALTCDYTIIKTPEQILLRIYNDAKSYKDNWDEKYKHAKTYINQNEALNESGYYRGKLNGILTALDTLKLHIKGINE